MDHRYERNAKRSGLGMTGNRNNITITQSEISKKKMCCDMKLEVKISN